jgi:hypothetical protein
MAVNQSQVDHILSTASADDPEVKLQNLQDEVDLLKKSVKKLLIDLRERMNELDNPFILSNYSETAIESPKKQNELPAAEEETPEETLPAVPGEEDITPDLIPGKKATDSLSSLKDEDLLAALHRQIDDINKNAPEVSEQAKEKPKLQKLHKIFEWTARMVKKYGHDRMEIMMESYRSMGYVSDEYCTQIKDIARLMPQSIGEYHEIGSEEFVAELYVLNRILYPDDSSLDREMIDVMMDNKSIEDLVKSKGRLKEEAVEEDWIDMLEEI